MAANTQPIFEKLPSNFTPVTFTNSDASNKKTIVTADSTNGSRVDSVMISTDDTTAVNLAFYITISGTDYYIGNVNVPIGSGFTTVVRVEAMTTLAPYLQYLALAPSALLKCNCVATMTSGKTCYVVPMGGDF